MNLEQSPRQKLENLTDKQRQILSLYCQGLEYRQIANELHYTPNTIKTYLREIRSILGIDVPTNTKLRAIIRSEYCRELEQLKISLEVEEIVAPRSDSEEHRTFENSRELQSRFSAFLPVRPIRWVIASIVSVVILLVAFFLVLGILIGQNNSRSDSGLPVQVVGFLPVTETTTTAPFSPVQSPATVLQPGGILIDGFEEDIDDWYAARRGTEYWKDNEVAIVAHHSSDAAVGNGALKADFDFNLTDNFDPRATYLLVHLPVEDWTPYSALQFQAKSLVDLSTNIRVFIALATGEDSCWNELGDFQYLGLEYQTFTFDLDRPLYKTCQDPDNYDEELISKEQVVRLHLIFIAEHNPSGAVLVDEIRLLEK